MTKSELQTALAEAAQTDKKTAGAFLNALVPIAYYYSVRFNLDATRFMHVIDGVA